MLKVEKILRRLKKEPPKGGYRPLLNELRRLLTKAEASLEKSQEKERLVRKKWLTISCNKCLRPLMRVDPKGPFGQKRAIFLCIRCERLNAGKRERRRLE